MSTSASSRSLALLGLLSALHLSACGDDSGTAPTITRFDLSALTVDAGQTVTIDYQVTGADTVEITAQPGGSLLPPSAELSGRVTSAPLTANTTFVITARNASGNTSNSKSVTVRPSADEVRIVAFTATPSSVELGQPSTLAWETANATSVGISTSDGAVVLAPGSQLSGSLEVTPAAPSTSYVLTAQGPGGPVSETRQVTVEGAPEITDFSANPNPIRLGESTTLSWTSRNADSLALRDGANAVVLTTTAASGAYELTPGATATYTLVATRAGFPDDSATVTVTVNPREGATIVSFTASPSTLPNIGESSSLAWVVQDATGIEIQQGGATIHTSSDATGSFTVTPTQTTDYTLWARNPDGDASATARVTVNPSAPAIVSFSAAPNPVLVGANTTLAWTTLVADSVRVLRGTTVLFEDAAGRVAAGSIPATITSTQPEVFTFEATNANGTNRASVTVFGQFGPIIDTFEVSPTTFELSSVTATLTWSTQAAQELELLANGAAVTGFPTTSTTGQFSLGLNGTTRLELVARSPVGEVRATRWVTRIGLELEPNGTSSTAVRLVGDGSGVRAAIDPAADQDYYVVNVPEGGYLWAWTDGGAPNVCNTDTFMHLLGPDGTTQLGTDDDDGPGACSDISPARDAFARALSAGDYYLRVRHFSASGTGTYTVYARVEAPVCGDGAVQDYVGETCDDGNTTSGDGCSATCRVESPSIGTLVGTGVSRDFAGGLSALGQADFYRVELTSEGYILAETFVPTAGRCDTAGGSPSANTVLRLYDADFALLGSDDDGGINSCSRFDEFAGFNRVPAGTYFVSVEESGRNALLSPYLLRVRTVAAGCGNGFIEAGEACDDGNLSSGDGCSATCAFEGVPEVEPNANSGEATALSVTPGASVLVSGELPANDVDFFAVNVPDGHSLDASVTVGSLTGCPQTAPFAQLSVYGTDGTTLLGNGAGNCPRAWPFTLAATRAMTGGTYYLRVRQATGQALPAPYFLHVRVIAPGCGNGIFEEAEQCDDGNVSDGDGCSAACQAEILDAYSGPAPAQTFVGSIEPAQGRRFYEIELTQESYLFAETFVPITGVCTGGEIRMELFDATQASLGAVNSTANTCARIRPWSQAWSRQPAGTYLLMVEERGNDALVPAYELVLEARVPDQCGNEVVETNEQCDDGNATDGDGCSSSCRLEPDAVVVGPGVLPGVSQVVNLSVAVPDDVAVVRVELSSPGRLTAFTGVPVIGDCTAAAGPDESNDTRIFLFDEGITTQLASNDDSGGTNCSRIADVSLAAGAYMLLVDAFSATRVISNLQLQVDLVPSFCGDGRLDAGEQCDDGGNQDGDGCSAACQVEVTPLLVGPGVDPTGVTATATVSLGTAGLRRSFEIEVTDDGYFAAATGVPTLGSCTAAVGAGESNDTALELFDAQNARVAFNDDFGGTRCSRISGARLAPGTYRLEVRAFSGTVVISALELEASLAPADVCGNGVVETGAGEACDDGNLVDGDGCSATCQVEGADISVSVTPAAAIPDSSAAGFTSVLAVPATPACVVASLRVSMNITHTWRGDLILDLTSPAGTTVRLHDRTGSSADDIIGTYGLDLTSAEALSGFDGQDPAGDWTLTVSDNAGGDTGTLNSWGLQITCQ